MNPAFIIIVAILLVAIWFCASGMYKPIGKFIYKIGKDAYDSLTEIETETNNYNEKE